MITKIERHEVKPGERFGFNPDKLCCIALDPCSVAFYFKTNVEQGQRMYHVFVPEGTISWTGQKSEVYADR